MILRKKQDEQEDWVRHDEKSHQGRMNANNTDAMQMEELGMAMNIGQMEGLEWQ